MRAPRNTAACAQTLGALVSLLAAANPACSSLDDDHHIAAAVGLDAIQSARSVGLAWLIVDGVDEASLASPTDACQAASRGSARGVMPASCVEKRCEGSTLHLSLDGCSLMGSHRLVSGNVSATFSCGPAKSISVDVVDAGDLRCAERPIAMQAGAVIDFEGGMKNVIWSAQWATSSRSGSKVEQTSHLDIREHTAACLDISGATQGNVQSHEIETDLEHLIVCPGAAPSGGVIHAGHDGFRRRVFLDLVFGASSTAHVHSSSGRFDLVPSLLDD